jgi:ABC-type sulfate transport system permease component
MKEKLVLGGIVGVLLSLVAWNQHRFVDPHTVSFLPTLLVALAMLVAFFAMAWFLARRHAPARPAFLTTMALPYVAVVSVVYGIMFGYLTYQRHTLATVWDFVFSVAFSFLMAGGMMMIAGTICVAIAARVLMRSRPAVS